jgi:hypothetical protein
MMKRIFQVIPCLIFLYLPVTVSADHGDQRIIAGWLETVVLSPWQKKLRAKLDSGAKTSSIHARNLQRFERDGEAWVRFDLPKGKENKGELNTIEAKLVRDVLIKRHKMPSVSRPVVALSFCINAHFYTAEFTLADRGNFNYPVLLGRRFMKNRILIDPAATFLHTHKEARITCANQTANSNIRQLVNPSDSPGVKD